MKKKYVVFSFVFAFFLLFNGCSKILYRPAIDNVKSVALISVYMNRDFYNIKAPKASESKQALKTLARAVMKETGVQDKLDEKFNAQYLDMVSYAVKKYSEVIDGNGPLRLEPMDKILSNPSYQNFIAEANKDQPFAALATIGAAIKSADWYTAPNMIHVPADVFVEKAGTHVTYLGNTKDPKAEFRSQLAQLCNDLGVDAVAIVQLDMAYKFPWFSITIGDTRYASPLVSSTLIIVNKNGDVAVNTGLNDRGQGEYSKGKNVGLLRSKQLFLNDKSVSSYCVAIDNDCNNMKKALAKAFSKLK
jgi:hypothetical protein